MPAFYKIVKERRLVLSTASGVLALEDALAHQDQILADPDFDPHYSQLLDFTHITKIELSRADVHKLAERAVFWPTSCRAILVTTDLGNGLARLFKLLRENAGEKGIRIFRSLDDALEWIFVVCTGR
jgi:hypothetical protein